MIPTILLTGFLGAGKTTLLNRLIDHYRDQRVVLLINEFGKVGIDGERLNAGNYQKIELNKGSLFCICIRTDFIREVERIADELKPELLIIEATGLSDTTDMEKMLALPNLRDKIQLKVCICLVDAMHFMKIKDNLRTPVAQVKSADVVVINKIDLVPEDSVREVEHAIRDISPQAELFSTSFAQIPLKMLGTLEHPESPVEGSLGEGRPDPLISLTLTGKGRFTKKSWKRFSDFIAPFVMRLKGFISLEGDPFYIDATPDHWITTRIAASSDPPNRLVLIGSEFDAKEVEDQFRKYSKS